jgi:isoquinoline 1-oxidoreductase
VAGFAEVAADRATGRVKVVRVVTAFECGAVVNPEHLKNQIEGAVVMGLGGALFEAIHFKDGKIVNPRFSQYRMPRFADLPALETVLLDRKDREPAGAGETPIVAVAPAVGNAIFQATGIRRRSLPLLPIKG